jgi:hypothetical protein
VQTCREDCKFCKLSPSQGHCLGLAHMTLLPFDRTICTDGAAYFDRQASFIKPLMAEQRRHLSCDVRWGWRELNPRRPIQNVTAAALYNHHCTEPTLRGEWWTGGQIPCLIAVTIYDLVPDDRLSWNFNQHNLTAPYAMRLPRPHAYRRSTIGPVQRSTCSTPLDCPRQRMIPVLLPWHIREDD